MRKQYLNPKEIFHSLFFTHTTTIAGPAKMIYVSGQVSYDRDGFVIGKDDMRAQAEQVFKSLTHNLKAAYKRLCIGCSRDMLTDGAVPGQLRGFARPSAKERASYDSVVCFEEVLRQGLVVAGSRRPTQRDL